MKDQNLPQLWRLICMMSDVNISSSQSHILSWRQSRGFWNVFGRSIQCFPQSIRSMRIWCSWLKREQSAMTDQIRIGENKNNNDDNRKSIKICPAGDFKWNINSGVENSSAKCRNAPQRTFFFKDIHSTRYRSTIRVSKENLFVFLLSNFMNGISLLIRWKISI